jgi:hypothetical protein
MNGRAVTVAELANVKLLPADFISTLGLIDLPDGGVGISYFDRSGKELAVKRRTALRATEGSYWPKGQPLSAYGLWRLDEAVKAGFLILVEGESDCWALWFHRLPALGIPGANAVKTLAKEYVEVVETIYIHREPDQGGTTLVEGMVKRLVAIGFKGKVFELRMPDGIKDPADLHAADAAQFKTRLKEAICKATPLELPRAVARNGQHDQTAAEPAGLATTCLDTIRPVPVRWLVPGHLPLGKLILLAGDGGHGKSTLTLDLAACLTTGRPCFGLTHEPMPPSDVLLVSCEDDFADTVVPRLLSAGADLARIRKVDGIPTKDGKTAEFCLAHVQRIEEELMARRGIRLVVIDPAGAYVGRSGVDDYNDSELRSLLGPLAELAARCRVTILLVKHFVKGATAKAVHKVGGSAGYVNTVRAAFIVTPDADDADKKLFLSLKFNLGSRPSGIAYRMRPLDVPARDRILDAYGAHLDAEDRDRLAEQLYRIEWEGTVDADADRVLSAHDRREREGGRSERAAEWLQQFLAEFAYPSEEILARGKDAGFSRNALFAAKKVLGIAASNRVKGVGGPWYWGLSDPSSWRIAPDTGKTDGTHGTHGTERESPPSVPTITSSAAASVPSVPSVPPANSGNAVPETWGPYREGY